MEHKVETQWKGQMQFEASIGTSKVLMDAALESGGTDAGPQPKKLMLAALTGCTGMDVVSILQKMKVNFDTFKISVQADVSEEHPKYYTKVHLVYEITGKDIDRAKVEKAVQLSQEKYCGVSHMFRHFSQLTYEIQVIENT